MVLPFAFAAVHTTCDVPSPLDALTRVGAPGAPAKSRGVATYTLPPPLSRPTSTTSSHGVALVVPSQVRLRLVTPSFFTQLTVPAPIVRLTLVDVTVGLTG